MGYELERRYNNLLVLLETFWTQEQHFPGGFLVTMLHPA